LIPFPVRSACELVLVGAQLGDLVVVAKFIPILRIAFEEERRSLKYVS
jgi:hypothetical protein